MFLAGVNAYKEGKRSARFYLAAFIFLIVGGIINILANMGVIPFTPLSNQAAIIGSAFEAIILALGLADAINVLKKEALEKAIIIEGFNKGLEKQVKLKTIELRKTLLDIEILINNMAQSVFAILPSGVIVEPVSQFSLEIFEEEIQGK